MQKSFWPEMTTAKCTGLKCTKMRHTLTTLGQTPNKATAPVMLSSLDYLC